MPARRRVWREESAEKGTGGARIIFGRVTQLDMSMSMTGKSSLNRPAEIILPSSAVWALAAPVLLTARFCWQRGSVDGGSY